MTHIQKATKKDISRIAEILVFTKRMNYRRIFQDDKFSFGELQVLPVAKEYENNSKLLDHTWVYCDDFVKGLIQIEDQKVETLYVDHFFENEGIGGKLLTFAIENFDVNWLWVLEKNGRARVFYEKYGFCHNGTWTYEEGTTEKLLKMER